MMGDALIPLLPAVSADQNGLAPPSRLQHPMGSASRDRVGFFFFFCRIELKFKNAKSTNEKRGRLKTADDETTRS